MKSTNANLRYKNHDNTETIEKEEHTKTTEIVRSKTNKMNRKETKHGNADGNVNLPEHNLAKRRKSK